MKGKGKKKVKKVSSASTALNINKKKMLEGLEASLGVVTQAAKLAGLNRGDHYNYMKNDPDYAAAVLELENVSLDFTESKLFKEIEGGNITAIIFHLKCKGKRRGYIDHVETEQNQNPDKVQEALLAIAAAMRP